MADPLAPAAGAPYIARDRGVLVVGDAQRVVGVDVFREAVDDPLGLGREGAEKAVPDDEDAAEVAVQIPALRPMMHAVMRRGVERELEPAPHLVDALGVDP